MTTASEEDNGQPLVEHLIELRRRLIWAAAGVLLCFLALVPFAQQIYAFVARPLLDVLPENTSMIATDVVAPFFVPLKVAAMAAFLLSLPNTLYQVWAFVAPALYRNEKRLLLPFVLSGVLLFAAGMGFCYFLVFPVAFKFFAGMTPQGVNMATDIGSYLSFVMSMFLAFGLTFEVPVAVVLLNYMGIVRLKTLQAARRYVIVAAFVIAAVFTPPDVLSQIMLALPMIALYEAGLWMCRFKRESDDDGN